DQNECTIDGCAEELGCVNATKPCPRPANPCHVATCGASTGCGETSAPDGMPCGTVDCVSANVCVLGNCITIQTPEGFPCSPPTPCQAEGRCTMGACKRPDAGVMAPELTIRVGGAPTSSRPMMLSYAGQLFAEICALPVDAGAADAGSPDAGAPDGG